TPRGSGAIGNAVAAWEAIPADDRDEVTRDQLLRYWIDAEALRLTTIRAAEARKTGTPGPEGSTAKLHWADLNKAISSFTVDLLGAAGMVHEAGYTFSRPTESSTRSHDPMVAYLRARANSIEGGTSEIMKNILG